MRIIVFNWRSIVSRSAGGAEVHLCEIFSRIAEKGNMVQLIASCDDVTRPKRMMVGKVKVWHVCKKEVFYPIFSLLTLRRLPFSSFDIIIEDVSKLPILWPLLLSKVSLKPYVMVVHHVHGKTLFGEVPFPLNILIYFVELFSLKFYTLFKPYVITVSESTRRELILLGFKRKRIIVIPNGINSKQLLNSFPAKKSQFPFIAYFGRVKKYKRLDHLIKALEYLPFRNNVRVIIAGKGDHKVFAELSELALQSELKKHILFLGEVDERTKTDILQRAWVYAIPSMKEGFGISVIEAQAYGLPVVAYAVHGIIDSVKNMRSGILVRDGDVRAFAKALEMICENESLREKLSQGALKNVKQYNWDKSADQFLKLLKNLISK